MLKKLSISLFFVNLILILVFWWLGSSKILFGGGMFIALGRLAGLLAEFLILVELVLISRIPFVEKSFGFDKLNKIHRGIGYGLLIGVISHPLFLTIGYASQSHISLFQQFVSFLSGWEDILPALIGLCILIIVGIVSIPKIRWKLKYETWHFVHLFMYLGIGLFLSHQMGSGDVSHGTALVYWFLINFVVFGGLIAYRFFRPIILYFRHGFYIEKVIKETEDVYSVYIVGKNIEKFKFNEGQYINISFLTKKMWQPHPFSLSHFWNGKFLRISVKNIGDFTSEIKNIKSGTKVLIDGPLGIFTKESTVKNKYLFIAGGIGITPIMSMTGSLSDKNTDFVLLYANKTITDVVFKNELENSINIKNIYYVFSQEKNKEYENGYIDEEKIKRIVPDFKNRDIYICGPGEMMDSLLDIFKKLGVDKRQIHYEKFYY